MLQNCKNGLGTAIRIIPCLDVKARRVVKGTRFVNLVDSGDPAALARRYEAEGADEIALLDISATQEDRNTTLDSVVAVREVLSIPLMVGGGVRSVSDACRLLDSGADRVSINSAAVRNPSIFRDLATRFGVQCVVAAIDAKRVAKDDKVRWTVWIEAGSVDTGLDAVEWARRAAGEGAGEILLTCIDRDGTGQGYDLELLRQLCAAVKVPVVASGGASKYQDFLEGVNAGARAVLAAGVFHRGEIEIGALKDYLYEQGVEVRR